MKRYLVLLLVLLMASSGSADLESKIASSCGPEYEALISMYEINSTSNNLGHPDLYENKVCVKGLAESEFRTECDGATAFYASSNTTTAHFSSQPGYNLRVCTGNVLTEVRSSCLPNEEPLFKVSERISGFGRHVAGPWFEDFESVVCGRYAPPENVTVAASYELPGAEDYYFDGQEISSGFEYSGLAEFPYLVSTDGDYVAGLVGSDFKRASYDENGNDQIRIRKDSEASSFYLVFTQGTQENIEDDQSQLLEGEFLRQINPSFGDFDDSTPKIRAVLEPRTDIKSQVSFGSGTYDLEIKKIEDGRVEITTE